MVKKLLDKYKAIPITVKASFWFLICGFVQRGISLITTPIFSRLLSTSEYGDFSVYQTWYNIIIIFASLNLASGVYMRGLVKYEEDQDRFTGSLQCLYMLTTAICFGIYMLFQNRWDKFFGLDSSFIYAMFIDILAATAYQFWSTRQRVDFKYRNLVIMTALNAVLRPAAGVLMIYIFPTHKLEARIYSMVAVDAITFGFFFFSIFTKGVKVFTTKYWKYALAFNLPLVPHYLSQIVLNQSVRMKQREIPYFRRTIGVVFQDFRLIPTMTVFDNVAFALQVTGVPRRFIRRRVPYILNLLGLDEKYKHYPPELSGGEQQRVALARALVNNPDLLIADEPTGNIDPELSYEIVELLDEINKTGTTILMVTHEHELVNRFHHRTVTLEKGRMIRDTGGTAHV